MPRFLKRRAGTVELLAGIGLVIVIAVYAAALGGGHGTGIHVITSVGWWNLAVLVALVCGYLAAQARRLESTIDRKDVGEAIELLLKSMVQGYVFPDDWTTNAYRAYCHKLEPKGGELVPIGIASPLPGIDEHVPIPSRGAEAEQFVIAAALNNRTAVVRSVDTPPTKFGIWSDVKTVVAVPIFSIGDGAAIGTISMDTSLDEAATHFTDKRTSGVLLNAAQAIAHLWHGSA
jgi:hypothetical protein